MNTQKTTMVHARIPVEMKERIAMIAEREDLSVSQIIRRQIKEILIQEDENEAVKNAKERE